MKPSELDTCLFELQNLFAVYDKKIREEARKKWESIFSGHEFEIVKKSLDKWLLNNAKPPKPNELLDLIEKLTPKTEEEQKPYKGTSVLTKRALEDEKNSSGLRASDRVSTAFIILHKLQFGGDGEGSVIPPQCFERRVDMSKSEALEIVNEICAKYNYPEAIEDRFKIPHYWDKGE